LSNTADYARSVMLLARENSKRTIVMNVKKDLIRKTNKISLYYLIIL